MEKKADQKKKVTRKRYCQMCGYRLKKGNFCERCSAELEGLAFDAGMR